MVVMETEGSNCFNEALKMGKVAKLDAIKSIATSLGALSVHDKLFEMYKSKQYTIASGVVSDREAVAACLRFADDHRLLVEPACGAGLASVYSSTNFSTNKTGKKNPLDEVVPKENRRPIVIIVCGGDIVSLALLEKWKNMFGL